jgi:hypothetical protein
LVHSITRPTIVSGGRRKNVIVHAQAHLKTHLSSEHASVEPQITRDINQLDVCGNLLTHDDVDEVAGDKGSSREGRLYAIAKDNDVIGEHVLDRRHDARRRKVLPCIEDCLEDDDDKEDNSEGKV